MNYNEFTIEIKKICNIDLSSYKEKQMKRRIESLMKRNGHDSYNTYIELLKNSKQHLNEFLNYITINVSEFFRNPAQWLVLEQEIIPELLKNKSKLKIWSSACSTGEEPYSLAMLLHKMMITNKIEIIASDIDKDAVEKAKQGIYTAKAIANVPGEMVRAYFIKEKDDYIIKDQIKKMVDFRILNLLEDKFPNDCDLILCRNVMIYFTEDTKEKLYKKFYNALSNGGIFFVGSTEQILMPHKYGFINRKSFFYQRIID
ncbi:MAG TPA: protein-glutamate O-methyltransferase CheR [Thermoanaerobacterales bacterium]|uniref:CheR family methyltransferase n=1 Tax=Tepidanaerobacter sp. GT38 TaxID=2722793 RepID=UPI0018005081|nr:protein-glutamate O-methyltransferase CheR [Tepidanaerobacter sp. GT38]MCG1012645.1 protein-glutamate O-methyltransferase CheR [Tepidanaerobacter sp. GT38]HHY41302.1 protein-glutamate O-methyltransferase CheR [Thermoanaerobacterales bacterium]